MSGTRPSWWREGNRKLLVVMYSITWSAALAMLDRLTPEFATVVTVGVTAFAAANAYEHHTRKNGDA